ncbi:peroxide stress protein YaaA [Serinibacter arcticus]|uniref:Peroxide stress protein YaaA n=1 Tax=Serinibacter arcticus TaxID=1655435 RepID=A0A2U1ZSJ8_9MICO|nr:peroxide stress protein YaaA [Serinibacter arcticus]PWD49959.1 peroxide stress protein YaaA [Serinibacter arcticus]
MLLVLPPSRGQTPGPDGAAPLDLSSLSLPSLTDRRRELTTALAGTEHDPAGAPTARACDVLTGVLYAAADLPKLLARPGATADRMRACVLIASPLLGMVGPTDPVPASRLAMGMTPGVGGLGPFWRPAIEEALEPRAEGELVVDVRSSEFAPLWRPPTSASWVTVRVEQEVDGERRVVSHFAKHLRGVLVRHLLSRRGAEPTDARSLQRAARSLVRTGEILGAELTPSTSPTRPDVLTLVSP